MSDIVLPKFLTETHCIVSLFFIKLFHLFIFQKLLYLLVSTPRVLHPIPSSTAERVPPHWPPPVSFFSDTPSLTRNSPTMAIQGSLVT